MQKIELPKYKLLENEEWDYFLSHKPNEYIKKIMYSLKYENRFFVDERFLRLVYTFAFDKNSQIRTEEYILPSERKLFRARIYKREDAIQRMKTPLKENRFQGYNAEESFVPPVDKYIYEGRANPENIRYLYVAEKPETAILEVGAKPKDYVSVAQISVIDVLHLFKLNAGGYSFFQSDNELENRINDWKIGFMFTVNSLFQKPYKKPLDYLFCQFLSEFLKNIGFDGIVFNSSITPTYLEDHTNYIIFNYTKCKVISSRLFRVELMKLQTIPPMDSKWGEEK